jgi:hypothetical protein
LVARRLREHEQVHGELRRQPPIAVLDHIRSAWPSANIHAAMHEMTWRIVFTSQVQLLTSDNPAYFFPWSGLGTAESDLTFPPTSVGCSIRRSMRSARGTDVWGSEAGHHQGGEPPCRAWRGAPRLLSHRRRIGCEGGNESVTGVPQNRVVAVVHDWTGTYDLAIGMQVRRGRFVVPDWRTF